LDFYFEFLTNADRIVATVLQVLHTSTHHLSCRTFLSNSAFTAEGQSIDNLPTKYLLLAGGLGGTAGWLISYPIDNIKTNLQVAPPGTYKRHRWLPDGGLIDCFRKTLQQRSIAGLFNGLVPCLLRAFPVNACAYAAYEFSSKFLQKNHFFG
jgi:solute carrier family 25 carnitine/acylcarnitine transporter 20/29